MAAGADAILCGGFEISGGALTTWLETVATGRTLGFVGYGDAVSYAWMRDGVASVSVPVEALAERTAALLSREHPGADPTHDFAAELIVRGSAR